MIKTKYEQIVNVNEIGNPNIDFNELNKISKLANEENIESSSKDVQKNLLLIIDPQMDFMENGSLAVQGSHKDIENITKFIYNNLSEITRIAISLDTHKTFQIFHPAWWINEKGEHPSPFEEITLEKLDNNIWKPVISPQLSRKYVEKLEEYGKKKLMIWPYHCLQGTLGHSIEPQLSNMINFHSLVRKVTIKDIVKGTDPYSEMYGIIKPEYDEKNYFNNDLLNEIENYDRIYIGGEAKSHCVLESVQQILEYFEKRPDVTSKIYILEDCMSSIGDPVPVDTKFEEFKTKYKINIVKSTDI